MSDGAVLDSHDVASGSCPPMTVPAGAKAWVSDTDLTDEDDDPNNVVGTATLT